MKIAPSNSLARGSGQHASSGGWGFRARVGRAFVLFRGRWWTDMLAAAKTRAEGAQFEMDRQGGRS
jgi:hypothetical protein